MTRFQAQAIVLSTEPAGESDLRVQLLTRRLGRIWATAKGGLKSQKRFAGAFDIGHHLEAGFMTAPRSERLLLEHAFLLHPFPAFRRHPLPLARASSLIEIVSLSVPPWHEAAAAFDLLLAGLTRLHAEPESDRFLIIYGFKLLAAAGLGAELECCAICRGKTGEGPLSLSPSAGGVVCNDCADTPDCGAVMEMPLETMLTLKAVFAATEDRLARFAFSRRTLEAGREALRRLIAHHLPRPARALDFINEWPAPPACAPPF